MCGFKNVPVYAGTTRTCVSTCARGAGTHGDVSKPHTGEQGVIVSSAYQNLPTYGYHVLERSTKETFGSFPFSSLRIDREQHVPDSSNHSLSLIKLFSFSRPEGNKLLDCPVGLSPFSPSITNDLNVSIATSLHQRLPFSGRVHHLSSPDTLCVTQTTFKITEHIHILVQIKIHMHIHIQIHIRIRSHISISINICIFLYMSSKTPQHSKWNCVGANRPQHRHMDGHMVCVIEL